MNCSTEKIIPKLSIIINYMKKVGNHNSITKNFILSLAFVLTSSFSLFAQDAAPVADASAAAPATAGGDAVKGKELFNTNCAACHKLDSKATGPALRGTDSLTYKKWMYYKNVKIDTTKLELWKRDYHLAFAKKGFNEDQLKFLYNYISGE